MDDSPFFYYSKKNYPRDSQEIRDKSQAEIVFSEEEIALSFYHFKLEQESEIYSALQKSESIKHCFVNFHVDYKFPYDQIEKFGKSLPLIKSNCFVLISEFRNLRVLALEHLPYEFHSEFTDLLALLNTTKNLNFLSLSCL